MEGAEEAHYSSPEEHAGEGLLDPWVSLADVSNRSGENPKGSVEASDRASAQ